MVENKVKVFPLGKDVVVWSPDEVDVLKRSWHIVGNHIGALSQNPRQNAELGLPFLLLPEELSLLTNKGLLESGTTQSDQVCVKNPTLERSSEDDQLKHAVFQDLWQHGYFLTSGLKYGGDFLVYHAHPSCTHSSYIALVLPWKQPINNLVSLGRVGAKVKKNVLLCSRDSDGEPCYYTLEWAGIV